MEQQFVNALILGSIYTLFALGLTLSWGVLNVLNLAHGALFMLGGLLAWVIAKEHPISLVVLLPLTMLCCGVAAVALDAFVFQPIRRRYEEHGSAEMAMLIASLGAAAIPLTIAVQLTDDQVQTIPDAVFPVQSWTVLGLHITNVGVMVIAASLTLSLLLALFVNRSKHGHALRALAFDPETCGLVGISASRLAALTMFVSGALAGGAGLLLALHLGSVQAHMGDSLLLKAFAVIILGGVGSIGGGVAAAFLLALVETVMVVYVDADLKDMVAFALIIVLLLWRPQGLFARAAWERA